MTFFFLVFFRKSKKNKKKSKKKINPKKDDSESLGRFKVKYDRFFLSNIENCKFIQKKLTSFEKVTFFFLVFFQKMTKKFKPLRHQKKKVGLRLEPQE